MILTALANSVIGTEVFKLPKQPPEVLLKFKVSQNSRKSTYARVSKQGLKTSSQSMKAFKLQGTSYKLQVP